MLDRRWCEMRIAFQIAVFEHIVPHRIGVVAAKPVPPIVTTDSELRLTGPRFDQSLGQVGFEDLDH